MRNVTLGLAAMAAAMSCTVMTLAAGALETAPKEAAPTSFTASATTPDSGAEPRLAGGCALIENFDAYPSGSTIVPQGGWEPWDGDPTVQFGTVTAAQSLSPPNSLEIDQTDDIVHRFSGLTSGQWVLEVHQYIPAGLSGQQFVILLNTYTSAADANWSTQLVADSATGMVSDFNGTGSTPIIFNQWVTIKVEVDLDADHQVVSYDGNVVIDDTWSGHIPPAGAVEIAALDLFSNGATRVFYDDITLCPAGGGGGGACCLTDVGACLEGIPQGECELQGGEYLGDGSSCVGVQCGIGACCFMGQCLPFFRSQDCEIKGGIFLGSGSDCDSANCDELGACCLPPIDTPRGPVLPQPSCCITTEVICVAVKGGMFLGVGVPCEQVILVPLHDGPPSGWSHLIRVESNCPDPDGDSGPSTCEAGPYAIDPWITNGSLAENCEDFGAPDVCPLPADFFGPGSDPFVGTVCFRGVPLGPVTLPGFSDPLDFGEADTLIHRDEDPFDACELPSADPHTVAIRMEQMHLESIDPIVVTFNGGQDPEEWDVEVVVDTSSGQPGGLLTASKTHCNGGTFEAAISVCPTFVFTNITTGAEVSLDFCGSCNPAGIEMSWAGVPWVTFIRGNNDIANPVCSAFTPAVEDTEPTLDCDCNLNGVFDAGFNPCDPQNTCDRCGDTDGDGIVRFGDLLIILGNWGVGPLGDADCNGSVDFQDILKVLGNWD